MDTITSAPVNATGDGTRVRTDKILSDAENLPISKSCSQSSSQAGRSCL